MMRTNESNLTSQKEIKTALLPRRDFLSYAGVSLLAFTAAGCKKEDSPKDGMSGSIKNDGRTIDFATDSGLLNYVYALEQLEAAFYTALTSNSPASFSTTQKVILQEIKLHELAHKEFLKRFLGDAGIMELEFDFSSIDFNNAESVLQAAQQIEDLGIAAYNGAIERSQLDYVMIILSQISSVEARHASWIRSQNSSLPTADLSDLVNYGTDLVKGFDALLSPGDVLQRVSTYIVTNLTIQNL